jgi:hypothetical protein
MLYRSSTNGDTPPPPPPPHRTDLNDNETVPVQVTVNMIKLVVFIWNLKTAVQLYYTYLRYLAKEKRKSESRRQEIIARKEIQKVAPQV